MRVALLSLLEPATRPAGTEAMLARGSLPVGGRSLVRHQLALALALGARRVALLADPAAAGLAVLREVAAENGAQLHVIRTGAELVPHVAPADELLVLADGLLALPGEAAALVASGPVIPCFGIEEGLAAGFERIDINRADAGLMLLPGRIAARLGEVPADWSLPSALLRLGVQAGVPLRPAPSRLLESGGWRLLRSEDDAHRAETDWIRLHAGEDDTPVPGELAARAAVRAFGPSVLHAGTRPHLVVLGAGLIGLLSLSAGWFGASATAFLFAGAAWFAARCGALLARIEAAALLARGSGAAVGFDAGIDALLVVLATWRAQAAAVATAGPQSGLASFAHALFAPLVMIALLRLLPRIAGLRGPLGRWVRLCEDRLLIALALALSSVLLPFSDAVGVAALGLLALALWLADAAPSDDEPPLPGPSSPNPPLTKGD